MLDARDSGLPARIQRSSVREANPSSISLHTGEKCSPSSRRRFVLGSALGHGDFDRRRHHRRIVRHMIFVGEQKLQRVLPEGKGDGRFRLPGAEMQMIEVVRDRLVQRRQLGIDQEVMVPGIGIVDAGRRDAHLEEAEVKRHLRANDGAVLQTDEINARVLWCGLARPPRRQRARGCAVTSPAACAECGPCRP